MSSCIPAPGTAIHIPTDQSTTVFMPAIDTDRIVAAIREAAELQAHATVYSGAMARLFPRNTYNGAVNVALSEADAYMARMKEKRDAK